MRPLPGFVLLQPYSERDEFAEDLKSRTGLHMPTSEFRGVPNQGVVYELPLGYDGPLHKADRVVFNDNSPKGVNHDGVKVIRIKLEDIHGVVNA